MLCLFGEVCGFVDAWNGLGRQRASTGLLSFQLEGDIFFVVGYLGSCSRDNAPSSPLTLNSELL